MIMDVDDVTDEMLQQAAREGLTQPSDSAMWDERLYTTHAATLTWAVNGDDLLEESNYLTVLDYLQGVAGDDADEHVIDSTVSHWAVGTVSARLLTTALFRHQAGGAPHRAEALRRAMLDVQRTSGGRYAHPAFWAPFTLVGDGYR